MASRNSTLLAIMLAAVSAPALGALTYYKSTGDPTFQPLAITLERMISRSDRPVDDVVVARVDWPASTAAAFTEAELSAAIKRAFAAKAIDVVVRIRRSDGVGLITVKLYSGASRFAPMTVRNLADSIGIVATAASLVRQQAASERR